MSRIPQNFIDDLLLRADIVEVIDARVPLKKKGREFTACCPFHSEKTPSFTVSPDKQFYHCFGCGEHGTAIGFLMNYENLSYVEAIESIAQGLGLDVPRENNPQGGNQPPKADKDKLYDILEKANRWYQTQLKRHVDARLAVDYLKNRGLSGQMAKKFQIGLAPDSWDGLLKALASNDEKTKMMIKLGLLRKNDAGKVYDYFRGRIQFPIHDYMGRVIGFGGRILGDGEPKYLNSPETPLFHKGKELYGLYQARQAMKALDAVIVVEGYMDVVALHQYEVENVVATLGTATTQDHLARLFRIVKKVIFCFDGDRAGKDAAGKAMNNILPLIRENRFASFMFLPQGEDPDSYIRENGKDSFDKSIENATSLEDFMFDYAHKKSVPDSESGKAGFVTALKPLIRQLPAGIYQNMLIQRLAKLVNMSDDKVERYIFSVKATPKSRIRANDQARFTSPKANNLVHRAIGLLLEKPQLVHEIDNINTLRSSKNKQVELLVNMLDATLQDNLSSVALYERFSQNEQFAENANRINKEQFMLRGDLTKGLVDALNGIKQQIKINQSRQQANTASSGADINALIKNKNINKDKL